MNRTQSLARILGAALVFSASAGCQTESAPDSSPLVPELTGKSSLALDDVLKPPAGVSLLVLDANADRVKIADTVEALKGTVFHMFPPRLIAARVPAGADAALRALGVTATYARVVVPSEVPGVTPREAAFVDVFSSRFYPTDMPAERRIVMKHAVRPADAPFEAAPTHDAAVARSLATAKNLAAADQEAYAYVPYASGTIVVSIILPESNGVGEPSTENWTRKSILETYQKVQTALEAVMRHEPNAKLRIIPHYESAPAPGGLEGTVDHDWEAIRHVDYNSDYTAKERSLAAIYSKLLGRPVDSYAGVHAYVNKLRDMYKADGAFVVHVANGENGTAGLRAYASFNGPSTQLSTHYDWNTFEHEFGHIFGAGDEYCPDQCIHPSSVYGYLGMVNANATYLEGPNGGINNGHGESQPSLMTYNVADAVNVYTRGAWGWLDSDGDGLIDVRDTAPASDLSVSVEAGGVVRLTGIVTDTPAAPLYRTPFSMNRIVGLEYRVDPAADSPWFYAPLAGDTRGRQAVSTTIGALPPGAHRIEARALNDVGNVEPRPRALSLVVPARANTNTPPRVRLVSDVRIGATASPFTLRATSADAERDAVQLRFDTNGDGTYDTPFGTAATATARFARAGVHSVKVQARDARGATSNSSLELIVLDGDAAPTTQIARAAGAYHGAQSVTPTFEVAAPTGADAAALDVRWLSERIDPLHPGVLESPFARGARPFSPTLDTPIGLKEHALDITAGDEALSRSSLEQVISLGQNRLAIAAGQSGVVLVDIADRAKPRVLGRTAVETYARKLLKKGNLLYVLGGPLAVVDISNPASPREQKQRVVQTRRRVVEAADATPIAGATFIDHSLPWGERIDGVTVRLEIDHPSPADLSIELQGKHLGLGGLVLRAQGTPGPSGKRVYQFTTQNSPALAQLAGKFAMGTVELVVTDHASESARGMVLASRLTVDTRFRAVPVMPSATDLVGVVDDQLVVAGLGLQILDVQATTAIRAAARVRGEQVRRAFVSGSNVIVGSVATKGGDAKLAAELAGESDVEAGLAAEAPSVAAPADRLEKGLYAVSLRVRCSPTVTQRDASRVADSVALVGGRMYFTTGGSDAPTTTVGSAAAFLAGQRYVLGSAPLYVGPDPVGDARTLYATSANGALQQLDVSDPRALKIARTFVRPYAYEVVPLGGTELLLPGGAASRTVKVDETEATTSSLYRVTLEARRAGGAVGRDTRTVHVIPYNHAPTLDGVTLVAGTTELDTFRFRLDITDPDRQPSWDPSLWAGVDIDGDGVVDSWTGVGAGASEAWAKLPKPGRYDVGFVVRDGFGALSVQKRLTVEVTAWQSRPCGGASGATCGESEFCRYDVAAACGVSGGGMCVRTDSFVCADLPTEPVCGCDHAQYTNACYANVNGTSVASLGACPVIACGGASGAKCPDAMFCRFPEGSVCGGPDGSVEGTCEVAPTFCGGFPRGGSPVCGCDGVTYEGPCQSSQGGTDMRFFGSCETGPNCLMTGCDAGQSCARCMGGYVCMPDGAHC